MLRAAFAALGAWLSLAAVPALAIAPALRNGVVAPIATAKPFGPGSPGFLPTCTSTINVNNEIKQAGNLTNADWPVGHTGTGATSPTVTATNIPDPNGDGGFNVYQVTLPAISSGFGTTQVENVSNSTTTYNAGTMTYSYWVLGPNGTPGVIYMEAISGPVYSSKTFTFTGNWQQVSLKLTAPGSGALYAALGFDMRDTNQSAVFDAYYGTNYTGQTIYYFGPQAVTGATVLPFAATTTTAAYNAFQTITANCPPGVAFRDFQHLNPGQTTATLQGLPYAGIYIQQGSISGNPSSSSTFGYYGNSPPPVAYNITLINGGWVGLGNCTNNNTTNHGSVWGQCWYSAPNLLGPWTWQALGMNASTNPTNTGTAFYNLHSAPLPGGCNYGGTTYAFCTLVSGQPNSGLTAGVVTIMYANSPGSFPTLTVPNSAYFSTSTLSTLNVFGGTAPTDPSIPACILDSGTFYCFMSTNDNNGSYTVEFSHTSNTDVSTGWTLVDYALRPRLSSDWDAGYSPIDTYVFKNKHGFYEMFYTAYNGTVQYIGYAVAAEVVQPSGLQGPGLFYKQNAFPIAGNIPGGVIAKSGPFYNGSNFIGDSWAGEFYGYLMVGGNSDNALNLSPSYFGVMPDY